jgi:ABC-type glycerol-3-phosphate transport system permease component
MKKENTLKTKTSDVVSTVFKVIIFIVLCVYAATIIYLLFWGLLTSLKSDNDFTAPNNNMFGLPDLDRSEEEVFGLHNYVLVFTKFTFPTSSTYYWMGNEIEHSQDATLLSMLGNTLFYAAVQSVLPTLMSAVMAYLCARFKEFKSITIFYYVALIAMMIPTVGTYPAEISILQNLGIYDTPFGFMLQKSYYCGTYFFVFYAFFKSMAGSYMEAAEIDGASQYRIFFQIVLPLISTTFFTIVLIQFVAAWNDFRTPMLYMPTMPSIAYGVYRLTHIQAPAGMGIVPVRIAACMFLALPILVLFLFFKEKLMGNISMGGLKE